MSHQRGFVERMYRARGDYVKGEPEPEPLVRGEVETFAHDGDGGFAAKGMVGFVTVSMAARTLGVTPRRVRALLSSKRLTGWLHENGYWRVRYPLQYCIGTRGPTLTCMRPVEVEQKETRPKKPKKMPRFIHETQEQYEQRIATTN